ncbi:acid-sensing ion channel 4-B-like [Crassostrea virginica]
MKVADVGRLAETGKDQEESVTSSSDTLLGDLWADLKSNTSLHGLSRISTKKTVFHGVFWGAMTLFMVLLLIGAFVAYGLDYFSYETLINIKLTRQAEMTFPSVTICNVSPINISRVNQSEILNMYYLKTHIYGRFFHSFINISDPFYAVLHENRTDSWLNETKFSKEMLFYHKEFEGQPCSNCFEDRRTDIGMCTTFNGLSNNPPLVSKLIGSQNGLSIFVFLDQNNYIYGENLGAGLLVAIHERDEEPNMADNSFLVSAGTVTYVPFRRIDSTFLPYPYKAFGDDYCTETSAPDFQNPLKHYKQYSSYACIRECRARFIYKRCQCRHINDFGNETICTIAQEHTCVRKAKEKFDSSLSIKNNCKCPLSCHQVAYDLDFSSAKIPSTKYEEYFSTQNLQDLSTNHIELRFFYHTFFVENVQQVPKIDLTSVLGNVGGYMGIFLGASLLTLMELLEVFMVAMFLISKRLIRKVKGNVISSEKNSRFPDPKT